MNEQFKDDRKAMYEIGVLYQQIVKEYGNQIEITYVDPRNLISIAVYMFRQVRNDRIRVIDFIKNIFWHARRGAVFLNGRWLNEEVRSNEELMTRIQQDMS